MIHGLLIAVGGIMVLEFLIAWIKALLDTDYSDECYDCKEGFCTLEGCKRERRNEKRNREDYRQGDQEGQT